MRVMEAAFNSLAEKARWSHSWQWREHSKKPNWRMHMEPVPWIWKLPPWQPLLRAHGIPFGATKVISDELDFEVPGMAGFYRLRRPFQTMKFIFFAALRPGSGARSHPRPQQQQSRSSAGRTWGIICQ